MIYLILMLNGFRSNKNVDEKRMPATIFFLGYGIKLTQRNFDNKHLCIRNVDDTKSRKMLRRNEPKKKHTHRVYMGGNISGKKSVEIRTFHISSSDFCYI